MQDLSDHLKARHLVEEFSAASELNLSYLQPSLAIIPASARYPPPIGLHQEDYGSPLACIVENPHMLLMR